MNSLKILHTTVRFYPYMGGVEHSVYHLSKNLLAYGLKISVICARTSDKESSNEGGIIVKRIKSFFKITNTNITLSLPFYLLNENYDILHTHMPTPWSSDWSILIATLKKKKSIITIHNDMDKPGFLPKLITGIYLNTIFRISLYLVNRIVIVNSNWETAFNNTATLLKKYEAKISTIPNGVDLSLFNPNKTIKKDKSILFVSILDHHHLFKGLDYLLEAMTILKKIDPEIKLTVVGEGELKDFYLKKAQKFGISSQVIFAGKKTQKELVSYYNNASLFILPSIDIEGFGNVLIEAMACKIPVITTSKAGMSKDIEKYNCGIIIPTRNSKAICDSIIKIFKNPHLSEKMGENGRQLVENKYTWSIVADQTYKLYQEVIQ